MLEADERHVLALRNTLLSEGDGRYVLAYLLKKLCYFTPCMDAGDVALRNVANELLEDCGLLFVTKANDPEADASIRDFVEAISKLDVIPLIDAQLEAEKKTDD
jgi:hypothetical protein